VAARKEKMSILGVTLLTSADEETLRETGLAVKISNQVLRLAKFGVENGIDGVIASPREIEILRTEFGSQTKIVVPGIRPSWSEPGDQKRVMTPRAALEAGADFLVIGRPIIAQAKPREAALRVIRELDT
jgi:orotidine-5'-phosphate decarboxylase